MSLSAGSSLESRALRDGGRDALPPEAWTPVCSLHALVPDVGVRALVGEDQVALFRLSGSGEVFAIDAFDPFSKAPVLSRGIVGDLNGQLVVASPIFKQHFNLETGACLEDESVTVDTFPTRVVDGWVEVGKVRGRSPTACRTKCLCVGN